MENLINIQIEIVSLIILNFTSIWGSPGNGLNKRKPKKLKTACGKARSARYWHKYRTRVNQPYFSQELENVCGEILSKWDPRFDP